MEELLRELIEAYLRRAGVEEEDILHVFNGGPLERVAERLVRIVPGGDDRVEEATENIYLEWM